MDSFTDIRTVFNNPNDRNLDYLSGIYDKHDHLLELIREVFNQRLSRDSVRGRNILLKPNWVKHPSDPGDQICLYTNNNFLLASLESVLEMSPAKVTIGDAPIQGCDWGKLVTPELSGLIMSLGLKYNVPVLIKDFRRTIFNPGENKISFNQSPLDEYLIFDLGSKSFLEPVTISGKDIFRVTGYDPLRMSDSHKPGVHKYCISKELLESDIVISLPKIKVHQKTGITGALKNLVGFNGDKDFLPHHRIGGTEKGGDCYPGDNSLRYFAEKIMDRANRNRGNWAYHFWLKIASAAWRLSFPGEMDSLEAGWSGNDTTWRMVLDINIIVLNGLSDGTVSDTRQRKVYSLCDGIIAGQGDGPLYPHPLPLGILSFTDNGAVNDSAMAILMGFDNNRFPLLAQAEKLFQSVDCQLYINSEKASIVDLAKHSVVTVPPKGWKTYLK
jgi:uncharacterized protein (DUF362 family)